MSKANLTSLMGPDSLGALPSLTMLGAEYEFEWYEAAVPAAGKVYLKVTTPANKYTVVNYREIRMDQTRGFYRQYRTFSGGTVARTITPVKMRGDGTVNSSTLLQVVTAPTVTTVAAFSAIPLWGAKGVGNRPQGGGLSLQGAMRIIAPNTSVLLEFENNSAAACAWYAYFKQFEIKPATMLALAEV